MTVHAATPEAFAALRARRAQSGEAAGLVSVSTTRKGDISDLITVDKQVARFTRLQKNVGIAAKLHMSDSQGQRTNICMVTLTYRPGVKWHPTHLTSYMDCVRNWYRSQFKGRALRYVWVAETTQAGVIHYHAIFWLHHGVTMPKADKRGWWPHGMTNTLKATKPVGYVMSYAKKLKSKKDLPHGARIYGVGGLCPSARRIRRWVNWPAFVQARASVADGWSPAVGGGWLDRATGEVWPSEFGLSFSTSRHTVLVRLHDHGRPLAEVCGPWSHIHGKPVTAHEGAEIMEGETDYDAICDECGFRMEGDCYAESEADGDCAEDGVECPQCGSLEWTFD